jgi:two-component sensor histidine kinase
LPVADTAGALRASDGGEVPLDAGGKEGFGLSFVKRSVDDELDGKADLTLDPSGLRCTIGFLLRKGIVPERAAAAEGGSDDG